MSKIETNSQSSNNLNIVKRLYAAFTRGDAQGALEELDENIEWNEAENFTYADRNPYRSPAEIADGVFGRLVTDWKEYEATPSEYLDAGDVIIALGKSKGINAASGKKMDAQFAHIWRLSEGKITGFQQYIDTLQVWRATQST